MERIIIEYAINYEKYIRQMFPEDIYDQLANKMLQKTTLKHVIYTQIGYDEPHNERIYHIADQYKILDTDTNQYLYCDDPRIDYGLKQLFQICDDHYITRNEKKLLGSSITWEIIQVDIPENDKK